MILHPLCMNDLVSPSHDRVAGLGVIAWDGVASQYMRSASSAKKQKQRYTLVMEDCFRDVGTVIQGVRPPPGGDVGGELVEGGDE